MKKSANLKKVKTHNLKIGMFVVDVGQGWLRHPWATKTRLITSPNEIQELLEHNINEVTVDLERGSRPDEVVDQDLGITRNTFNKACSLTGQMVSQQVKAAQRRTDPRNIQDIERRKKPRPETPTDDRTLFEEIKKARQAYLHAIEVTHELVSDIRSGQKIKLAKIQDNIEQMIDSVFRNRDALSTLLKIKSYDEYTFTHSVNVAALCLSFGRHINLPRKELSVLGLGAILHDVGKILIPGEILNKPGKLTDQEFEIIKTHSDEGARFLVEQNENIPDGALKMVRHHHERLDGSGYPDGLDEARIEPYVAIISVVDVYDALSSKRSYKSKMPPHEALKVIFSLRGRHFIPAYVDRFVQCLGVYPVGSLVELTSGETGVVITVNHAVLTRPQVRLTRNILGRSLADNNVLDLNNPEFHDLEVRQVLDSQQAGVDISRYFKS